MKVVLNSEHIQVFYNNWHCEVFIESDRDYGFISDVMALSTWPNIVRSEGLCESALWNDRFCWHDPWRSM